MSKTFITGGLAIAAALLPVSASRAVAAAPGSSAGGVKADKNLVYRQQLRPEHIDNHNYTAFYSNENKAYNLKGFPEAEAGASVLDIKVNPAAHSLAMLAGKPGKTKIYVRPLGHAKVKKATLKNLVSPTAICYTPDSRRLVAADSGRLLFFDSRTMEPAGEISIGCNPEKLVASPDGYYIAAAEGKNITVVNVPDRKVHRTLESAADVTGMDFNPGAQQFGAVSADSRMTVWSTPEFTVLSATVLPAESKSISFHPEGKYAAVTLGGDSIGFFNLIDAADRTYLREPRAKGAIDFVRFVKDARDGVYVVYNTPDAVNYKRMVGFATNFTKMLEDELEARMLEWSMMRPLETEEEYRRRVNDETRREQRRLFANEITTGLAGDLISHEDVVLGGYNPESGSLLVSIGNFADVYLPVDKEDLASISPENLEFRNTVYGLKADDTFELIYTEVYDKSTGKTYRFDNLDRQNLDFLKGAGAELVPFEIMQKQSREDATLQNIRKDVVEKAVRSSSISEHTQIEVNSRLVPTVDASGKRINNYKVDFTYTVEPEYSDHEDFAPGKYRISESSAARALLQIVNEAFANDLAGYLAKGKKVVMNITGTADATPIARKIAYDGSFGSFDDEPCNIDGELTAISVTPESGITTNQQLAFMRAQAVRDHVMNSVRPLGDMEMEVNYNIGLGKERGAQFRRINVSVLFVDPY